MGGPCFIPNRVCLQVATDKLHKQWMEENRRLTKDMCEQLLFDLKKEILDPVLAQLTSAQASSLTFESIVQAYDLIESKYKKHARGAEDVCASVFADFQPVRLVALDIQLVPGVPLPKAWFPYNRKRHRPCCGSVCGSACGSVKLMETLSSADCGSLRHSVCGARKVALCSTFLVVTAPQTNKNSYGNTCLRWFPTRPRCEI